MKKILFFYITLLSFSSLSAQIDRSIQPKSGPAPEIKLEDPKQFTLKNGMTVMIVENHKLPRVSASLVIDNSPVFEGELAGVNQLLGNMLGKGSISISKNDFEEEIDYMGASVSFGSSKASAQSLSRYFSRVLELMADAILNPNFLEEELKKEKDKLIEELKLQEKNVSAVANRIENLITYGRKHPFGEFVKIETIEKVELDDIKKYYNSNFNSENAYLVIVGDVNFKTIKKQVRSLFSKWNRPTQSVSKFDPAKNSEELEIHFTEMDNAVQSEVSIAFTNAVKKTDSDYFAMLLANSILGGGAQARLFLNLREDKGYTYGSYSSFSTNKYSRSSIRAFASVRNAVTDSSVVELVKEIEKIRTEKVTKEELDKAKAKFVGDFVIALEKPETVARYALNIKTEKLPADFYKTFLQKINAVTIDDVLNVSEKYFTINNARIFVTSKGSEVLESLEKIEPLAQPLKIYYYDKDGISINRPDYSSQIPEGITVKGIINNYLNAIGGVEKLKAISSKKEIFKGSAQGLELEVVSYKTNKKQHTLTVSYMGNILQKQVFNKDKGYEEAQGQKSELTSEKLEEAKQDSAIFLELDLDLENVNIRLANVNGTAAYELVISDKKSLFYDQETFLKLKSKTIRKGLEGQVISQEVFYEDYKEVDGILFPHKIVQIAGEQKISFVTELINLNGEIDSTIFN